MGCALGTLNLVLEFRGPGAGSRSLRPALRRSSLSRRAGANAAGAAGRQDLCVSVCSGLGACALAYAGLDLGGGHATWQVLAQRSIRFELGPGLPARQERGCGHLAVSYGLADSSALWRAQNRSRSN